MSNDDRIIGSKNADIETLRLRLAQDLGRLLAKIWLRRRTRRSAAAGQTDGGADDADLQRNQQ